jgi:hypothetical protein
MWKRASTGDWKVIYDNIRFILCFVSVVGYTKDHHQSHPVAGRGTGLKVTKLSSPLMDILGGPGLWNQDLYAIHPLLYEEGILKRCL